MSYTHGSDGKSQGVSILVKDNVVTMTFNDRGLNFYTSDSLKNQLKEQMAFYQEQGYTKFVMDFTNVKIVDSTGIGAGFIVPNNVVNARGGKLAFCCVKPFIEKILEIMRVRRHLQLFPNLEEAMEYLS